MSNVYKNSRSCFLAGCRMFLENLTIDRQGLTMKKFIATACIIASTVALAACSGTNETKYSASGYANERTAGDVNHEVKRVAPKRVERTFQRAQIK